MIINLVIGAVIGFVAGWLVTRNNKSIFEPLAQKIDGLVDKVKELEDKLDKK